MFCNINVLRLRITVVKDTNEEESIAKIMTVKVKQKIVFYPQTLAKKIRNISAVYQMISSKMH